jgi:mannose/fructose-specific phosphotransferase system component IIA
MDISGVNMPAVPEVVQEPPRDAQVQNAIRETAESGAQNSESRTETDSGSQERRQPSSNLGHHVDERV